MDEADLSEGSTSGGRVILPPVEMGRLGEIELAISNHIASAMLREKMANAIENENVIAKLIDLFHMCEDLDHSEGLRYLYSITKNMFMLNRNSINDTLLDDRYLKDVIGMLEYDPAHEEPRKHREFLFEKAKFREVLPIASDELKEKIHKTYRVQYLQDVCLPAPSLFEENLLSVLNSYIFFSRIDIVTMLQKDRQLMKELFEQLKDPETGVAQRRDLAFFLKEFITLSSSLPSNGPQSKDNFYKALSNNDILGVIEPCIISPDVDTRVTIVEMLALLVEHNPQQVRDYLLRQAKDKQQEQILLNRLISHMQTDRDPELTSANQVAQVLRTLLDPDTMVSMQKADRSEFLQLFYTRSIGTLVKPLADNVQGGVLKKDDYVTANRQALVVRLLCFCIEHHSHSMRSYAINNDLLNKVLVLLKSKHHFLSLSALKILRTVIGVKNDYHFYFRHIVKERVLDKVVECFKANGNRYNLLNSAILELFDFIRSENIKTLVSYTIENHQSAFENITYVKLFTDLKIRYEQNQEREQSQSTLASTKEDDRVASPVFVKERQEEQWFEEDDEEESSQAGGAKEKLKREDVLPRKSGIETMFPSLTKRKSMMEDEDDDIAGVLLGATAAAASNHANSPPGTNNPPVTLIGPGAQQDKKLSFVIKLGGDRSRTPSPSGSSTSPQSAQATSPSNQNADSRDDEVSSSQNHKHNEQPPSPVSSVRSLVDYDESDSDEEESNNSGSSEKDKPPANENKESGTSHHPDSIPTSSTGSPVFRDEKNQAGSGLPSSNKESSPDDDVSSTSGDNDDKPDDVGLTENKETATANGHPEHPKKLEQDSAYPVTPRSGKRPSSESLTDEQADAKRSKIDQTGPESETAEHAEQHLEANSDQTQDAKA
ncbi:hypothetical protein WR25_03479 isoform A [Diploscapter pachys]|uniref:Serine/threonine-protein phosphatase 4 regulatory subunit 3-like central domain-containing protein n=1 Tax=Diploscapter pachys TaxID=2018661 RepID=A0A2A2LAZ0_9BILA|nr:hypothetical protein WR25_03479 isoform A [Diploscapter pachys]